MPSCMVGRPGQTELLGLDFGSILGKVPYVDDNWDSVLSILSSISNIKGVLTLR